MAWIESHTALEKHPKLLLFKSRMRWSKNEAVGFLHRFWWTVLDYAPNGVVTTLSAELLAEVLEMEPQQIAQCLRVMEQVGFVRRQGNELLVNDWLEYAGTFLRNSKYRRAPEKWARALSVHGLSNDSQTTVGVTNLPTNQPTAFSTTGKVSAGEAERQRQLLRLSQKGNKK